MKKRIAGIIALCLGVLLAAGADAQWRVFTTTDGLADDLVRLMLEDRKGNLWLGTDKGLNQYHVFFTTHLNGLAITALSESTDGRIWVGTNQGLYVYNGTSWDAPIELMGMHIVALLESMDGRIWAGTNQGLYVYNGTSWDTPEALGRMSISALLESADGQIWAGTVDKGLWVYDGTRWETAEPLKGMKITVLHQSTNKRIWVGTQEHGLQVYDGTSWTAPIELSGLRIFTLLESTGGAIWAGTTQGLYVYNGTRWGAPPTAPPETAPPELSKAAWVISLLQSRAGTIWAGTLRHSLWVYNGKRWEAPPPLARLAVSTLFESKDGTVWIGTGQGLVIYHLALASWRPGMLTGLKVYSLLERPDGTIWAGTDNGLWVYDGARWSAPEALTGVKLYSLLELTGGEIWAGTSQDLWVYDGTNWGQTPALKAEVFVLRQSTDGKIWAGTITRGLWFYDGTNWNETPVRSVWAISVLESRDGRIWAGTENQGLWVYNGAKWSRTSALADASIFALLESTDGMVWVGTLRKGLFAYDGTRWDVRGNFKGLIHRLFQSKDGRIWAGTNEGVQVYDGGRWGTLTILDGLPNDFIVTIFEDSRRRLWFGTERGVGVYQPNRLNPPAIQITKIAGQPVESPYLTGISALSIEWNAIDQETSTQRLTYQHQIDAGGWEETSANFITTPAMTDGEHTFSVRAIDRDFNYSEPATLTIIVDTSRPVVLISSPPPGAIVGGTVQIIGGVTDTDFAEFQVDYAEGASPSAGDFKPIGKSNRQVESGILAEWDTKSLGETQYTIRVRAIDNLGHTREDTVTVLLDHTPPIAELTAPQEGARLTEQTQIRGTVSDSHLDGYVLEYTTDPDAKTALWRQIFQKTGLLQTQQTLVDIQDEWQVPITTGSLFIRLTAFDAAGNSDGQVVAVEVPQSVTKDKGGRASSSDGVASLSIPPRSLPADTVVTINPVPPAEIQPAPAAVSSMALAYDIGPENLELSSIKPATLQIKLADDRVLPPARGMEGGGIPSTENRLAFFRWQPLRKGWVFFGGTVRDDTITMGITRFGRYAVMAVETTPQGAGGEVLFTCQPRAFSPQQGATTISFYVSTAAAVTLRVYDLDGRLQRTLVSAETMGIGSQAVVWDGKDENGRIPPSGPYLIALSIGNGKVKTKSVVIQNR
ncbi:hypothetical protein HYR99_17675 [Candidatus Poribacteria bacterium]|nr:hypothetical protein [Candidatus Poribacteria bacterium]